jgi:hypothetical protein
MIGPETPFDPQSSSIRIWFRDPFHDLSHCTPWGDGRHGVKISGRYRWSRAAVAAAVLAGVGDAVRARGVAGWVRAARDVGASWDANPFLSAMVKLSSVASKLTTVSAQDMIRAMIAGQRDPHKLAALARTGMKAKHDELAEAPDGMFDDHHGELAQLLLDQIAALDSKITQLTARAADLAAAIPAAWGINADGTTGPEAGTGPDAAALPAVERLAEIPGVSENLARAIIAEVGLDMARFPTAGHLVSWAGLCPSTRQSGTRTRAGKKGRGNTWLRNSLGQAATGAARTTTFLQRAVPPHRPPPGQGHRPGRRRPLHPGDHLAPAIRPRRPVHRPRPRLPPGLHRQRQEDKNHIRQIEALLNHPITITITKAG